MSCAIGVLDSPAALCALQLADKDTNPPAQILLQWQCTQKPQAPWVRGAPQPPVSIFLKSSDFCPTSRGREVFQFLGQCLPTGNVARIPELGILAPGGVCQGCCCGCAGSTRLHTMGKSNINWAACLQEAEAALEESSTQCKGHIQRFGSWALLAALTKRLQYHVALEKEGCLVSTW